MLLHTEYSLLSLLHTQDGVVHHHGLFQVRGPTLLVLPGIYYRHLSVSSSQLPSMPLLVFFPR